MPFGPKTESPPGFLKILRPFKKSSYQFHMQWFANACEESGIDAINPVNLPWSIRLLIAKLRMSRRLPFLSRISKDVILVPGFGYPDSFVFPFAYVREIVPFLWDTWPRYHNRIVRSFNRHGTRLAFFTQRRSAEIIHEMMPATKCVWIPEGIDTGEYLPGGELNERSIDLLELGRLLPRFHDAIVGKVERHEYRNPTQGLLFPDFKSLVSGISQAKITVCFPRCDTHPDVAGDIETLTQRYWECMLSRTIMLGRCPAELKEFIGYNPVVEVDWKNPCGQVFEMLRRIGDFQPLVNKNRRIALMKAPWKTRVPLILENISECMATVK